MEIGFWNMCFKFEGLNILEMKWVLNWKYELFCVKSIQTINKWKVHHLQMKDSLNSPLCSWVQGFVDEFVLSL